MSGPGISLAGLGQDWGRAGGGVLALGWAGGWAVAVLTNGVPEGYSPVSQCLRPRCKGLHPRNLPVRSFCLG